MSSARPALIARVLGYLALICAGGTLLALAIEFAINVQTLIISPILWVGGVVLSLLSVGASRGTRPRGENTEPALIALAVLSTIAVLLVLQILSGGE